MKKLFLLLLFLAGCRGEEESGKIPHGSEFTKEFSVYESISGERKWYLKADSAITKGDTIRIYGVHLKFLENDRVRSIVVSDSGLVIEKNGNLIAYGNVNVRAADSIKLFTDSLKWNNKKEKILVDGGFNYKSTSEEFQGEGLESDAGLKHIRVKKRIMGKGRIEK